jgi:hypothetical protein
MSRYTPVLLTATLATVAATIAFAAGPGGGAGVGESRGRQRSGWWGPGGYGSGGQ